ncbi:M42 family metallopeptidase [Rubrobacter aplysinae]|uniref:M42 family metallopeptidase n=1 Tax=Rubrobacter aplysinae TaxID=909625 RepID=UPI00064C1BC7|nr:M42 family metallopeptidase [Rubrobacter aplysinae]
MRDESLRFLKGLLSAPGTSGHEVAPAGVWRDQASSFAAVRGDSMGNSFATLNEGGSPRVMLSGHVDEIGVVVTHVDDQGLVHFKGVGGWDPQVLVGQRIRLQTRSGEVRGVIGKKAIHLMEAEDRKKVSDIKTLWIDVGAKDADEAREMVRVGDVGVIDQEILDLPNDRLAARSLDNRTGAFVVLEALRLLSEKSGASAEVTAVASVQEEIGANGARSSAFGLDPDAAIAVDVTHATDVPGASKNENGDHSLGSGPVITRASTLSPIISDGLMDAADRGEISYSIEADAGRTGTDADAIHFSRAGVASGLVSVPNRYMHSPNEVVQLDDLENAARLIADYIGSLDADTDFVR